MQIIWISEISGNQKGYKAVGLFNFFYSTNSKENGMSSLFFGLTIYLIEQLFCYDSEAHYAFNILHVRIERLEVLSLGALYEQFGHFEYCGIASSIG